MYGEWVVVDLGEDIECKVWVTCTPTTPQDILQRRAIGALKSRLPERKSGIWAYGDALTAIGDYEYSQGYGMRYELEQRLKAMTEEEANTVIVESE